ncbi:phosphatidate cytidylyltransferase [Microbacterium aquimaris]|uniref:phosphatidate cytidylyltransferase n=1 Tax=Microbacterium aquimaris TaxID=459816 RepID=UPI002AD1D331|nr:phosphatidate cytidylyltransferase [Microbacterium aquimaris]MDZ8275839.1 phosphatidate cytidylyltransferase [Microbacterium aquimaris]
MTDAPDTPSDDEDVAPPARRDADSPRLDTDPDAPESSPAFQEHMRAMRTGVESQMAHARAEFDQANERIKERTGRDLIVAILIGVAIGGTLLLSLVLLKWIFVLFALVATVFGILEISRALTVSGRRIDVAPQVGVGVVLVLSGLLTDLWLHWVVTFVAVVVVAVWRLIAQMVAVDDRSPSDVLADVLTGGFVQLYVPFLGSLALVLLRQDGGEWWIITFILIAVVADTGAYVSGLTLGRHPMAPKISPKKTWEGFAGAAVAALAAGVLACMFMLGLPWWTGLIFGAAVLLTATAGDLGESMIKRDMGIKDMSSWLPGHGGVLDRLDSILPSVTVALALSYLFTPLVVTA